MSGPGRRESIFVHLSHAEKTKLSTIFLHGEAGILPLPQRRSGAYTTARICNEDIMRRILTLCIFTVLSALLVAPLTAMSCWFSNGVECDDFPTALAPGTLKSTCEGDGGTFHMDNCPAANRTGRCTRGHIVYNYYNMTPQQGVTECNRIHGSWATK